MSGTFNLYDSGLKEYFNGAQDWDTNPHRLVLLDATYTPSAAHDTYSDISGDEVTDLDYDPQDMGSETVTLVSGVVQCDAADVSFGTNVSITATYAAIVEGTVAGATGTDKLVGYLKLHGGGQPVTSSNSVFSIAWASDGIFKIQNGGTSSGRISQISNGAAAYQPESSSRMYQMRYSTASATVPGGQYLREGGELGMSSSYTDPTP